MNKLKSIQISNYKCFKRVSFNLQDTSILIGENNAGKSTAIPINYTITIYRRNR